MTLLDRYLGRLQMITFINTLGILTGILIIQRLFKVMELASMFSLDLFQTLSLIAWSLPIAFFFSVPIALLAGTLLALGKLAGDNEIVAARAAGVSRARLSLGVLAFSAFLALVMTVNNLWLMPQSYVELDNVGFGVGIDPIKALEPNRISRFGNRLLAVRGIDRENRRIRRLFAVLPASDFGGSGAASGRVVLLAADGRWRQRDNHILFQLERGSILELNPAGAPLRRAFAFSTFDFALPLPTDRSPHPKRLPVSELLTDPTPPKVVELSRRLGGAWVMPFFALCALPLAYDVSGARRRGKSRGVVLYAVLIYFVHWLAAFSVESLTEEGVLPYPFLLAPYLALAAVGAFFWTVKR